MTFNDLHPKHMYQHIARYVTVMQYLLTDKRLRISTVILMTSLGLIVFSTVLYIFQKNRLGFSIAKLSAQTTEILRRAEVNQHQAEIPKFQASMKTHGAYLPPISANVIIPKIANCFLQKNKPQINIAVRKQEVESLYTIQSFYVKFQSSYDYEIFSMMEYILSNSGKFGYTRLREFEIEQLFESSPIVKGRFVYDQMSLTP